MLDPYQDIDEDSNFDHYFESTVITSGSQEEPEDSFINNNYANSHGQPTCKQGEMLNYGSTSITKGMMEHMGHIITNF